MTFNKKSLTSLQKAGELIHAVATTASADVKAQVQSMVESVAVQPMSQDTDFVIARFRRLSQLNQGLLNMDAQLRELYAIAEELTNPAANVVMALPAPSSSIKSLAKANAVDVIVKSEKTNKVLKSTKAPKKIVKKFKKTAPTEPKKLTANDSKLMEFLRGALKPDDWTNIAGAGMAEGSGLPKGSIGVSLKKLIDNGVVQMAKRGSYRLAA